MKTTEGLLEAVFSIGPTPRLYKEDISRAAIINVSSVERSDVKYLVDE
jgi:hypothetical protein